MKNIKKSIYTRSKYYFLRNKITKQDKINLFAGIVASESIKKYLNNYCDANTAIKL